MTDLRSALERYLSMRKGLGYKYQHQTRRLADFVSFMERREATSITTKLAMVAIRRSMRCWRPPCLCRRQAHCAAGPTTACSE